MRGFEWFSESEFHRVEELEQRGYPYLMASFDEVERLYAPIEGPAALQRMKEMAGDLMRDLLFTAPLFGIDVDRANEIDIFYMDPERDRGELVISR